MLTAPPVPPGPPGSWPPDPSLAKADLRRLCRRRRREALPAAAAGILEAASRELPSLLAAGGRLGLYWPLAGEADLRSLAEHQGWRDRLALPAIEPCRRLVYRPWRSGMALLPDDCGIPSPPGPEGGGGEALPAEGLALLLVPALAVDATGLRSGVRWRLLRPVAGGLGLAGGACSRRAARGLCGERAAAGSLGCAVRWLVG
jgi:5-formyltetrahydrofolate cyclo-ligase